jgi:hypothetical protein
MVSLPFLHASKVWCPGAYHIDPNLDVPDHATPRRAMHLSKKAHSRSTSSLAASKNGKRKDDHSWHPTTAPEACNAIFETKSGNVEILLSVGGVGSARSQKANVDVKAKYGRATVRVIEIAEGRRLNLDIATGKGVYSNSNPLLRLSSPTLPC